jgi:hypothetical protein
MVQDEQVSGVAQKAFGRECFVSDGRAGHSSNYDFPLENDVKLLMNQNLHLAWNFFRRVEILIFHTLTLGPGAFQGFPRPPSKYHFSQKIFSFQSLI